VEERWSSPTTPEARDLDTVISQHHGAVLAEAHTVAKELGLPSWWLNEQATSYLPAGQDAQAAVVPERPSLTVRAAWPRHLLALKVRAARQSDVADIVVLAPSRRNDQC
jgi:hypothetical protein